MSIRPHPPITKFPPLTPCTRCVHARSPQTTFLRRGATPESRMYVHVHAPRDVRSTGTHSREMRKEWVFERDSAGFQGHSVGWTQWGRSLRPNRTRKSPPSLDRSRFARFVVLAHQKKERARARSPVRSRSARPRNSPRNPCPDVLRANLGGFESIRARGGAARRDF